MRRIFLATLGAIVFTFALLIALAPISVRAESSPASDYQRLSNIYDKTIYRLDNRVVVNDLVNGDLYCLGNTVIIDAVINGDVLCAGSSVIIKGSIAGNARISAKDITIAGTIGSNATLVGSNVIITKNATIANDASIIAQTVTIDGEIGRDLTIRADTITISGRIGRAIESYHYSMKLIQSANTGTIDYSSPNTIEIQNGAKYGQITQIESGPPSYMSSFASGTVLLAALLYVAWFISLIITALSVAFLFPKSLEDSADYAKNQPFITGIAGLLTIIAVPAILLVLVTSIIGIPLAVIIGLLFGSIVLLSTPFVAHLIGSEFFPRRSHPIRSLVGVIILLLLYAIPIVNIISIVIVTVYGTGLIIRVLASRYNVASQNYKNIKAPQ